MMNESRSRFEENITKEKHDELFLLFSDALYRFFTSTPNFDSRTGEGRTPQLALMISLMLMKGMQLTMNKRGSSSKKRK